MWILNSSDGRVLLCGSHPAAERGSWLAIGLGRMLPHGGQPVSVAVGRYVWSAFADVCCPATAAKGREHCSLLEELKEVKGISEVNGCKKVSVGG